MFVKTENGEIGELRWGRIFLAFTVLVLIIIFFLMSFTLVNAGFVGVVTRWGAVYRVAYPGITWKAPIADGIKKMDVRTQKDEVDAAAASKDLQVVTSRIAVNYHLDGAFATSVYQNVGMHYQEILIAPAIQNIFKAVTAQYTAEQLITKREETRIMAEQALAEQLAVYHIIVDNFNIVNFDFSPEFNAAIEAKVTAQQQVETAKQLLAKTRIEAETALAQAQGQANAQAALKDTGALTPEYLQYLALQKWNGILPQVTGSTSPFIDVSKFTTP